MKEDHKALGTPPFCEASVIVTVSLGLHARPAAKIAKIAQQFSAECIILSKNGNADGKSILDILSLAVTQGAELTIRCSGSDAQEALAAILEFFAPHISQEKE